MEDEHVIKVGFVDGPLSAATLATLTANSSDSKNNKNNNNNGGGGGASPQHATMRATAGRRGGGGGGGGGGFNGNPYLRSTTGGGGGGRDVTPRRAAINPHSAELGESSVRAINAARDASGARDCYFAVYDGHGGR
jgi:hypothetical protein